MLDLKALAARLCQAREVLAYSIDDVCKATGLEHSRLAAIESGTQTPSGDEILILASFYDCDFRAFLDENLPAPVQQTEILFRRFGDSFSPQDRRSVQEFLRLCETEAELEGLLSIPKQLFSPTIAGKYYKAHGEQASDALRQQLGYGENAAPRDVYDDFRKIGVHIFRRKLANADISGLYIQHPSAGHCVLINYHEDKLYAWLHYCRHLTDSDHPEVIAEHEKYERRPLTAFFNEAYEMALQHRLMTARGG